MPSSFQTLEIEFTSRISKKFAENVQENSYLACCVIGCYIDTDPDRGSYEKVKKLPWPFILHLVNNTRARVNSVFVQFHKKELIMKLAAALKMSPRNLEKELKPILPGMTAVY